MVKHVFNISARTPTHATNTHTGPVLFFSRSTDSSGYRVGVRARQERHDGYNLGVFSHFSPLYVDFCVPEDSAPQRQPASASGKEGEMDVPGHCRS